MSTLIINDGFNPNTGIQTRTHFADGDMVVEKIFDAEPHLEHVKQLRELSEGKSWGEGRIIGHLPPAFHAHILTIRGTEERKRAVRKFFQENPAFVSYDKYLKR